eukprot:Opistho-2@56113
MRRDAGFQLGGDSGLLRLDRVTQLGRVVLVQQVLDRVLDEIRVAQVAVAVHVGVTHRLDLVVHALGRMEAQILHRVAFENVHDLADHYPARAWRWRRDYVVATVVAFHRGQFTGLVLVEVSLGDDALVGLAGGDDSVGHPAFIEAVGAFFRDGAQGFRQVLLHQFLPDLHRLAVVQEDRAGVAHVLLEHIGGVVQQIDVALLQFETVFSQFDRRSDHVLARLGAVLAQRQLHARHGARHCHGEMATGAQVRDDVAVLVQVHVGGCRQRGFFAEVEKGLAPVRQLNGHEAATAEIARRGINHRQRITHGNRSIHRVAAVFQHIDADMGRQVLGGDHHAVLGGNRCHRRGVGHEAAQCQ